MADIDVTAGGTTGHPSRRGKHTPYVVRKVVTAANAVATKGSALASADVVQIIDVPADTVVMAAGIEVTTADTGTDAPGTVSIAGVDFVADVQLEAAGGKASADGVAYVTAADTLDIVLGTLSAAGDDWVAEVWCVMADVSSYPVVQSAKGT